MRLWKTMEGYEGDWGGKSMHDSTEDMNSSLNKRNARERISDMGMQCCTQSRDWVIVL